MPVLVLFLCLIGNYYTYHSKGDLVQVKEEIYSPVVEYYEGTTLQNSGAIENIYFNTNLSNEDIISIFEKNKSFASNYSFTSNGVEYFPFGEDFLGFPIASYGGTISEPTHLLLMVYLYNDSDFTYVLMDHVSGDLYWSYTNNSSLGVSLGWNEDVLSSKGVLSINSSLYNSYEFIFDDFSSYGVDIGLYNYLFNDFISSTPIEFISSGGDLIREETKYLNFEEYIGEEYIIPSESINGQFIDSISLNTNFNESEMLDIFQNVLDSSNGEGLILFTYEYISFGIFDFAEAGIPDSYIFVASIWDVYYCLYCPSFLYNSLVDSPDVLSEFHISNAGWNNLDLFPLEINSIDYEFDNFLTDYPLLITTEKVVSTLEKINLSFFDITLLQTDNTFIKFQLPFLRNAFESVFNILNFESSYVSSFVLTSFTWMIQLLLLHVVVDTLSFIFKMYHKLMDKVV